VVINMPIGRRFNIHRYGYSWFSSNMSHAKENRMVYQAMFKVRFLDNDLSSFVPFLTVVSTDQKISFQVKARATLSKRGNERIDPRDLSDTMTPHCPDQEYPQK
jgi:hypothetical protein